MKALITGASGFIGSTLIEMLTQNEQGSSGSLEPVALLRKSSLLRNLEGEKANQVARVEGDLRDFESLKRAVSGVDVVIHLAGVTAAPSREGFFEHNAQGTALLARAALEANPQLKKFVYVSSLAAGGPASSLDRPQKEDFVSTPVSAYGESKLAGEQELLKFAGKIPVAIVRPPIVYGPKDRGVFVLIRTVSRGLMPIISGGGPDGRKHYSQVHSQDLCRGILDVAMAPLERAPSGEIYYVSGDEVVSMDELLGAAARALGKKPLRLAVAPWIVKSAAHACSAIGSLTGKTLPFNRDKLNEILPDYWVCSNEKAKAKVGFKPQVTLEQGMNLTVEWYKKKGWL